MEAGRLRRGASDLGGVGGGQALRLPRDARVLVFQAIREVGRWLHRHHRRLLLRIVLLTTVESLRLPPPLAGAVIVAIFIIIKVIMIAVVVSLAAIIVVDVYGIDVDFESFCLVVLNVPNTPTKMLLLLVVADVTRLRRMIRRLFGLQALLGRGDSEVAFSPALLHLLLAALLPLVLAALPRALSRLRLLDQVRIMLASLLILLEECRAKDPPLLRHDRVDVHVVG